MTTTPLVDKSPPALPIRARWANEVLNHPLWGQDGKRAWWLIAVAGILLVGGIWIVAWHFAQVERQLLLDQATRATEGVAATFEQRTLRTIKNADVTALLLKDQYEREGRVDIARALALGIIPADAYLLISVTDASGTVVASSDPQAIGWSLRDRENFFLHSSEDTRSLDIGKPIHLKVNNHPAIQLSRRLNRPNGNFAGMVSLSVDPDFFTDFYSRPELGNYGTLSLLGADGVYRARRAGLAPALAPDTRGSNAFMEHARNSAVGAYRTVSVIDGVRRIVAYRKVRDWPLYVLATQSEDEVLADFDQRLRVYRWCAAIASVGILVFFAVLAALAWSLKESRYRAWARARKLKLASRVFESTADAIVLTDADDRVVKVNAAFTRLTGFAPCEMLGLMLAESPFRPIDPIESKERNERLLRDGHVTGEVMRYRKNGAELALWVTATVVHDDAGQLENCIRVFTDISALKASQRQLETLALVDSLTGLFNRRAFHDRLTQAIAGAKRHRRGLALLYVDLDRFKPINDQFGHETGDQLLHKVAGILHGAVRTTDTAFRVGGDEFAVILEDGADVAVAQMVAERLIEALKSLVIVNGHAVVTGASVGIALYPEHGKEADALVNSADSAMYCAKASGRNQVQVCREGISDRAAEQAHVGVLRLSWQEAYESGEPMIDAEHRELLELGNVLIATAIRQGSASGTLPVQVALDSLLTHVARHFQHEEEVLAGRDYPGLLAHKRAHAALLKRAAELRAAIDSDREALGTLVNFIARDLISQHILKVDRLFFPLFQSRPPAHVASNGAKAADEGLTESEGQSHSTNVPVALGLGPMPTGIEASAK
jgi:diguanylate cyclase (GGDEF)-like protein/hemerythrin-like metal-binding protein/PAS domain S-box-containing protein